MSITAMEITTMLVVKTIKLPPEFTPENAAGSSLFSLSGKLYLACVNGGSIFSVEIKLSYEQMTTYVL